MAITTFPPITRKDLLFSARKLYAFQWPATVPLITTVKNPTTGAVVLPDNGYFIGLHRKQRGGTLSNAQTYNDIMAHGEGSPVMKIATERRMTGALEPLELNRVNLENWIGTDLSALVPDAMGGAHIAVPSLPQYRTCRVVLLGRHDYNGLAAWLAWVGNRADISDTADLTATDAEVITPGYTWNFTGVDQLNGEPVFVELFGPGWQAMQAASDAGFFPAATSIAVAPPTAALTGTVGSPTADVALTVTASPGSLDRTLQSTYVSSDPTKATVDSSGVVRKVAAGSATITATYQTFTGTCVVTVT
jgi:hypothetical protein